MEVEREREGTGKRERENKGRETNRGQTLRTETDAVSHLFSSLVCFQINVQLSVLDSD